MPPDLNFGSVVYAFIILVIVFLVAKMIIASYFTARKRFFMDIINTAKELKNGKKR